MKNKFLQVLFANRETLLKQARSDWESKKRPHGPFLSRLFVDERGKVFYDCRNDHDLNTSLVTRVRLGKVVIAAIKGVMKVTTEDEYEHVRMAELTEEYKRLHAGAQA